MSIYYRNSVVLNSYPEIDLDVMRELLFKIAKDHNKHIKRLEINIMNDTKILKWNKIILNHDYYTDTISMNYAEDKELIEADILLSLDRIIENARKNKCSVGNEFFRITIHSMLHLIGYQDDSNENKTKMRKKEDEYLIKVSFT